MIRLWILTTLLLSTVVLTQQGHAQATLCKSPTNLSTLSEEVIKLTGNVPDIFEIDELKRMVKWYNRVYSPARTFPLEYLRGANKFLLVQNTKPTVLNKKIIIPGYYIGIVLYRNGCAWAWSIHPSIIQKYKQGTEAGKQND